MLEPQDRVVAGISGGADSVCLLFVLLEWAKRMPVSLAVVHVNHGIRSEAAEDEHYVEELCRAQGISFYPYHVDVRKKASEEGCSEEEAGRHARYQAFAEAAEDFKANKIAVAHNSNDRSETMLFHLFRGSGIRGLASIRPVREQIIRPILCLERREVEAYLDCREIDYCKDATNDGDDYTRNRIRHHILPYAEQEISSGCVTHMAQTADLLTDVEDYLELQTNEAIRNCVTCNGTDIESVINRHDMSSEDKLEENAELGKKTASGKKIASGKKVASEKKAASAENAAYTVDIGRFLQQHKVIQQRVLYALAVSLAPGGKDITSTHVQDLMTLFTESGNRDVCLPFGILGKRRYEKVVIACENGNPAGDRIGRTKMASDAIFEIVMPSEENDIVKIEGDSTGSVIGEGEALELRLLPYDGTCTDFPQNRYTKWFDYDKIKQKLELRTRRVGDYLTIAGADGQMLHKTVKEYMITEKIPREERDQILLLAQGQHVIWLMGYRISEYYKVDENTKHILQVQLKGNGEFPGNSNF